MTAPGHAGKGERFPITLVGNGEEERSRFSGMLPFSIGKLFTNNPTLSDNEVLMFINDCRGLKK